MYMQESFCFLSIHAYLPQTRQSSICCCLPKCQLGHLDVDYSDCGGHCGVMEWFVAATEQEHSKPNVVISVSICMHIPFIAASISVSTKCSVLPV